MRGFITSVVVLVIVGAVLYGGTYYLTLQIDALYSDLANSIGLIYLMVAPIYLGIRFVVVPLYHRATKELVIRDLHKCKTLLDNGIITETEYNQRIGELKKSL